MLNADFPAETANKRPSLLDILSGPAPRSPVRAARFDASPHIILTWAYLRLLKFLLSEAKRLFQQYRPKADLHERQNQRDRETAASMPTSCATIKAMTPAGAMPAKVSESERAIVTAGLANEVEAVNQ